MEIFSCYFTSYPKYDQCDPKSDPLATIKQWKKEQVWPCFGCCTADSQTYTGRHQLYNNDSLVLFSIAWQLYRNAEYTEAAVKFTRRLFNIAESAAMTKSYELYLLLPEEIDNQRYRSGLCGRETLVEPGATVNYRDLLIKADFARSIVDAPSDDYPIEGCNRYPRPKFTAAMFTKRQREEPKNGVDVSRDVICKKPQG